MPTIPTNQPDNRTIHQLFDLTGRVAIVTGGAGLLGKQFSRALAEAGAQVVIASRNQETCQAWAEQLIDEGYNALALLLDILVNNAYARGIPAPPEELTPDAWRTWIDAGLSGNFYCAQAAARPMLAQGSGSIINIGSIYGVGGTDVRMYPPGMPVNASVAYGAVKGGIVNLTRSLAVVWAARGVRVNCISPGGFPGETMDAEFAAAFQAKVPLGRMGNRNDLKGVVVFLASDAAAYVVGQNLLVDGGWTAW